MNRQNRNPEKADRHSGMEALRMLVGMAVIVAAADAEKALEVLKANGEDAYVIGRIIKGEDKIVIR